jgi:hypothetical protein
MLALLVLTALPSFHLATYERPRLAERAEAVLQVAPQTITSVRNPRSAGGLHDFSSEADYFWPNPRDPKGPYIERDGVTNPDNFVAHRKLLLAFARHVGTLAAAYRVTHQERYAAAARRHLHAWFVDPATRMNPNLSYSQAVRQGASGRSWGVIDTVHLAEVALAIEALRGSASLTHEEEGALTGWFRDYLHWLRTDPFGIAESNAKNNHATCAWLQIACFAHLVGDDAVLAEARQHFKTVLLPGQMARDGSFPEELWRTKPYGYSLFNLDVMAALAVVCSTPTENLLTWSLPDGRTVATGVAWLAPFIADKQAWLRSVHRTARRPHGPPEPTADFVQPDVMYWNDWPVRQPSLLFGALATGRDDWLELWKRLNPEPQVEEIIRNFPIREPALWVSQ